MIEVWVSLHEGEILIANHFVEVPKGCSVAKLKNAVKTAFAENLTHCSAAQLKVFQRTKKETLNELQPGNPLPGGNSSQKPFIVKAPPKETQGIF
jgi:hypothetical protein